MREPHVPMDPNSDDPRMHYRILASNARESVKKVSRDYLARKCKTPGAVFEVTFIDPPQEIRLLMTLPKDCKRLSAKQAESVENAIHDALELILAPYFKTAKAQP